MSLTKSGNRLHDDACNTAEGARQAAGVAGVTQATMVTAEILFYRACVASAVARGLDTAPFVRALKDLGTGGV
jgi:hypothetical protein